MKPLPPPPVISVEVSEVASTNGLVHRHTYFQETGEQRIPFNFRSLKSQGNKQRQPNKKLTVRLRPRKVLCSKCKSTCNAATESNPSATTASNSSSSTSEVPTRLVLIISSVEFLNELTESFLIILRKVHIVYLPSKIFNEYYLKEFKKLINYKLQIYH